jgi:hypothetical protein
MNKSEQLNELAAALAVAQGEIENASKASQNPHFKSKYADLAEVLNTVRPVFSKHGLSISQFPSFENGVVSVETILLHKSGQWMSGTISAPISKLDAQNVGSATTYCRRYSLAAVAGIAQEDDDANSAVGHAPRQQTARQQVARITAEQAEQIRSGLAVAGMNEADWCRKGDISSVEDLAADRFSNAMAFIRKAAQAA